MLPLPNRIADQYNLTGDIIALLKWDSTLFDNFQLPQELDRELTINTILVQCGDRQLLHPSPDWMKWGIEVWSKRMLPIWKKLYDTTTLEYNPIYNYDRMEEESGTREIKRDRNASTSYDETTDSSNDITNEGTSTHNVSAENVETYQPESQDITNDTSNQSGTADTTGSSDTDEHENTGEEHGRKLRAYGNIGVTTTQSMIRQERDVARFSIYMEIADDFASEFCLRIW